MRDGRKRLAALLAYKHIALIVDDVWDVAQIKEINTEVRKSSSFLIVTSRNSGLAEPLSAKPMPLSLFEDDLALTLFAELANDTLDAIEANPAKLSTSSEGGCS